MTRNEQTETAVLQRQAASLVDREVHCCMSSLVSTLAKAGGGAIASPKRGNPYLDPAISDLMHMADQAAELAAPILDYEGAAREAGHDKAENGEIYSDCELQGNWHHDLPGWSTWEACCADNDIEPHELEVYEHWAVSTWLAEKLAEKGERVDTDFAGLNVWARTTTGQAISADAVIEKITAETGYASGGEG